MQVLSLWHSANRSPTVDLFLESPIPFAGRPQDLADVERLREIANTRP
jgi:hypothetical protein